LQWEILFNQLWLALPTIQLSLQDPNTAIATGQISWRGKWYFNEWQVKASAATVQDWIPFPLPVTADGALKLNIVQLVINQAECSALSATLNWQQARLKTPFGNLPLDNPSATLSCKENKIDAKIKQDSPALHTQASLQLTMQQYKLQASLQPGAELSNDLRSSLDWLGTPDSKGIIRVKQDGHF
jgi:general secretion pathway protein N